MKNDVNYFHFLLHHQRQKLSDQGMRKIIPKGIKIIFGYVMLFSLFQDLKYNWQLMQKAFLQLPMLTDTIPKILKKTKMEQELKQLEKDIQIVEGNPYIYIYE